MRGWREEIRRDRIFELNWFLARCSLLPEAGGSAHCAPVAQMDRVHASEAWGREFESHRARHFRQRPSQTQTPPPCCNINQVCALSWAFPLSCYSLGLPAPGKPVPLLVQRSHSRENSPTSLRLLEFISITFLPIRPSTICRKPWAPVSPSLITTTTVASTFFSLTARPSKIPLPRAPSRRRPVPATGTASSTRSRTAL